MKKIYTITESFPKTEIYSLVDQMKRASISIGSNIAEWSGRGSVADNLRFLYIAKGSCTELEAQLYMSIELWYVDKTHGEEVIDQVNHLLRMITAFMNKKKEFTEKPITVNR